MTTSEFLNEIETIIEAEHGSITVDKQISSLAGWDSMSIISFIAMADAKLQVAVDITELAACKTIGDLTILVGVVKDES